MATNATNPSTPDNPVLPMGAIVDLEETGLVAVAVPSGAGDEALEGLTGGAGFAAPGFFRNGTTYYVAQADPACLPLASVDGGITFINRGQIELPAPGDWLMGHEPEQVRVPALPTWATDPSFVPPKPKPQPPPLCKPHPRGRTSRAATIATRPATVGAHAAPPVAQSPPAPPLMPANQPNDPHRLARLFLTRYIHLRGLTVRYWNGGFLRWERGAYAGAPHEDFQARLNAFVREVFEEDARTELAEWSGRGHEPTVRPVTRVLISNVESALAGLCLLPAETNAPTWIDGAEGPPAERLIIAPNGAFDPDTGFLIEPTPQLFAFNRLSFDIDLNAPPPREWLAFLNSLWADDSGSIALLQEWFGYALTGDTSRQKALLAIGPPRSGKSTIAAIMRSLVGEGNAVGPTLAGLAENFGLSALIGKQLAIVSDARLSGRADATAVTERILSITGEDAVTIDRKFKEQVTTKLNTRFMIVSNELPRFIDASGALASRFLVLRFTRSWFGKEDHGLKERLSLELPGILNWSLEGLARLRAAGRFTQPESGEELLSEVRDLCSPVGAFVRARCRIAPQCRVQVSELFEAWKRWCEEQGRREPGTQPVFGRDLRAAVPTVDRKQVREGGERVPYYMGIELGAADEHDPCHGVSRESRHCGATTEGSVLEGKDGVSRVTPRDTPDLPFEEGVIE